MTASTSRSTASPANAGDGETAWPRYVIVADANVPWVDGEALDEPGYSHVLFTAAGRT